MSISSTADPIFFTLCRAFRRGNVGMRSTLLVAAMTVIIAAHVCMSNSSKKIETSHGGSRKSLEIQFVFWLQKLPSSPSVSGRLNLTQVHFTVSSHCTTGSDTPSRQSNDGVHKVSRNGGQTVHYSSMAAGETGEALYRSIDLMLIRSSFSSKVIVTEPRWS